MSVNKSAAVYEWQGHKLYLVNGHYMTDTKEDYEAIVEHLQNIQHTTSLLSEENKVARWLFCDLFVRGCYREVEES